MGSVIEGSGTGHIATLNFMCLRIVQNLRPCVTGIPCSFFFPNTCVCRYYSIFLRAIRATWLPLCSPHVRFCRVLFYCRVLLVFSWLPHLRDLSILYSLQLICHRTFFVYCVLFSKQYIWRSFLSFCAAWMRSTHVLLVRFIWHA